MKDFTIEKGNFTTTFNDIFYYQKDDKRLSLEAWGLYVFMLSLSDNWDYTIKGLSSVVNAGRDKIIKVLQELENAGFLKREQNRNDGKFGAMKYTIIRQQKTPLSEKPYTALPLTENPTQVNTNISKKDDKLLIKEGIFPHHFHYLLIFLIKSNFIRAIDRDLKQFNDFFKYCDKVYDFQIVNDVTRYIVDSFKRQKTTISNKFLYFKTSFENNMKIIEHNIHENKPFDIYSEIEKITEMRGQKNA